MILASVAAAFLVLPLAGLLAEAPWGSLGEALTSPTTLTTLRLSLTTASIAALLTVVFGVPLAWVLARSTFPGRKVLRALALLPILLPPVVGGVALLLALGRRGLVGGPLYDAFGWQLPFSTIGTIIAQFFVALPFMILTTEAAFRSLEPGYEEAASTLGAGPWFTFRRVTIPLIAPTLAAGTLLAWTRALGEFGATIAFAGNVEGVTRTIPLAVFIELQRNPEGAILLSLLLVGLSLTVLIAMRDRWWPAA